MKALDTYLPAALAGMLLVVLSAGVAASQTKTTFLSNVDCGKCHADPAAELTMAGAAHRKVSCLGCHRGHPPKSQAAIPKCVRCHRGKPHFDKESCEKCHSNAHMPLRIDMPPDNMEICRECHASPVALIERGTSSHSDMTCSRCHSTHRQKSSCQRCHYPHSRASRSSDCRGCHQPHLPKPVVFSVNIPNRECAPCHRKAFELVRANETGHGRRSCISCHQRKHGTLPQCFTCHGLPHQLNPKAPFDNCHRCHRSAHDLVVWPAGEIALK